MLTVNRETKKSSITGSGSYLSIANELRSRVLKGEWGSGQKIASENELANEFNVCRVTVKKSLRELELEGLLTSQQGKGRYVVDQKSRNKSWVVGLLLFDQSQLASPVTLARLEGIQAVASQAGYHIHVVAMNTARDSGEMALASLINAVNVDGMIVVTQQAKAAQVERLSQLAPVVWLDHSTVGPRLQGVEEDHIGGAFAAARHLIELGHRRIALLTANENFSIACAQREGVRLAMREMIAARQGQFYTLFGQSSFNIEAGRELGRRFLELPDRPTAIISGSDELATGIYQILTQKGLCVPKDVSLVGWNDMLTLEQIPLPMTSVKIDFRKVASQAIRRLFRMIDGQEEITPVEDDLISAELIVRKSTASPAQ
jgi:LacI family transcriptional regulator